MKKNFTPEEKLKSHNTNLKAAHSLYLLTGVLSIVYTVRYFITGNFNFFFTLAFSDMFLKLGHSGEINTVLSYVLTAVFYLIYFGIGIAITKKQSLFPALLAIYSVDTACLLFCDFMLWEKPQNTDFLIDIICHFWVLLFLIVGTKSLVALKKEK